MAEINVTIQQQSCNASFDTQTRHEIILKFTRVSHLLYHLTNAYGHRSLSLVTEHQPHVFLYWFTSYIATLFFKVTYINYPWVQLEVKVNWPFVLWPLRCNHTGCVWYRKRDRDRNQNNGGQWVLAPVPVQVQCERFYIKPYNPFIHILVPTPVLVLVHRGSFILAHKRK